MLYVSVITESGALTLTSTKLQNQIQVMPVQVKHMTTLCRHEIKEKKKERSILFPLISLTLLAISGT